MISHEQLQPYNHFVQSLEAQTHGSLFFHEIDSCIYITNETHRLLGIWDKMAGKPHLSWKITLGELNTR